MNERERFFSKIDTGPRCWLWRGQRDRKGYGRFWWRGKKRVAQRVAWEIEYGEPPADRLVLHHCDNPPCVRPSHLWLGTPLDNMRDMIAKGRQRHPVRYGVRTWSKLTEEQVLTIRSMYNKRSGVTQQVLADRFGVSRRLIGGIVKGTRWRTTT